MDLKAQPSDATLENASKPMGATLIAGGVAFRVWAPNAQAVAVVGPFNQWKSDASPMAREEAGCWFAQVSNARAGDEYRYEIRTGAQVLSRVDPYAQQVTSSEGNGVIHDHAFDWGGDDFHLPSWNELVIYELHISTFGMLPDGTPGGFQDAVKHFDHLKNLGVNAIQVMPVAEFAGRVSWGYNPDCLFAVETDYGGPAGLKQFVKQAHAAGLAVLLDVVYSHLGPNDLGLWQFDGWNENGRGGIYFYNDTRAETPWGATRPDYGRPEVCRFIRDNVFLWLETYHFDGLRFDSTLFIRTVHGLANRSEDELPDGWRLMQSLNAEIRSRWPARLIMAEDLQENEQLTRRDGAGFGSQWGASFVHPIREAMVTSDDRMRNMQAIAGALLHTYNGDAFQRIVYSESHDDDANGRARLPQEIDPGNPLSWAAQKRSTLAAALVFSALGIPMLFEGQEFLQGRIFRDDDPLDWKNAVDFAGIVRLYRDLIGLRLNRNGVSRGLCGQHGNVTHASENEKLIVLHRWDRGGPRDDVIVAANFANRPHASYRIGLPRAGVWRVRFNSDWNGYSRDFSNCASNDLTALPSACDGCPCQGEIGIGPYSVVILSQD